MFINDLPTILQWWLVWLAFGVVFLPLTKELFVSFFDQGYIFSKILGILFLSFSIWLLGSLKIATFSFVSLFILWLIFLVINWGNIARWRLPESFSKMGKIWIFEESFFLGSLMYWSWVKGFESSIHGLEKYMDFGFINSILSSSYFPPKDMWMTPLPINYYYFGHLVTATVTKISGITPEIAYNLMLATLFAFTAVGSFSIGANLYQLFLRPKAPNLKPLLLSGFLSSFLVTLGGNLHTIYAFFQNYTPPENPVPFWTLQPALNFAGYWYPNATRFIPFTIHEFPIYSFVVSDLHGHVLNIPFVLLIVALLIKTYHLAKISLFDYFLLGLLIATSLMANVLDGPIYLLSLLFVFTAIKLNRQTLTESISSSLKSIGLIITITIFASLPFWLSFKPFASGIGLLCAPKFLTGVGKLGPLIFEADHCARSPFWMLAILWGFFYFVVFSFLFFVLPGKKIFQKLWELFRSPRAKFQLPQNTDTLVAVLVVTATILILIPEFFYAKDIYPAHYRANTVFKFGYQAFIILGLTSGYMITRIISNFKFKISNFWYLALGICLFTLVAIYPNFAVNSYFNGLKDYKGLDGLRYLSESYPSDYEGILWLRENVPDQPVILEAQGDSYTDYARVSANTGLPTVIGWPVHEWLWRGSYDEPGKRISEVTTIYTSADQNQIKDLLKKYNVSYIFLGALERQKYGQNQGGLQSISFDSKFDALGKVVFQSGETKIYQLSL